MPTAPPVTGTDAIDWLRTHTSVFTDTTPTTTKTRVIILASFGVAPGAVPDIEPTYGTRVFRPLFLQVEWDDYAVEYITLTGPRVLVSGELSKASLNHRWYVGGRDYRDHADIPAIVVAAVDHFESVNEWGRYQVPTDIEIGAQ